MKVKVERKYKKDTYTIGILFINGEKFCNTLEDKDRGLTDKMTEAEIKKIKVYGETAIPTGTYKVEMTYSQKYKKIMPELKNVKGYSGIRIHSGNTAKDSLGCLLLGENKEVGKVVNSRVTCDKFYAKVNEAIKKGELVTITIE